MEIREFSRNDRVKVDNCYAWDIGFRSSVTREDITIPAGAKGYALLTMDQVEEEIMRQNIFFVGTDGLGDHAGLKICDPDMYKYLFRTEDKTHHISKDTLLEVLKLSGKQKFMDAVAELIATSSEARMCLYFMTDIDWSEYLGWKYDVLVERCREFMPVA
ncbi:hypothetical protein RSAG_00283 [Ruminococcus sp. 5_1_39BFAA]|nr:hypothetical protein RSAG_00283 [Ruminococcus sp. 5_1_39BFAA]